MARTKNDKMSAGAKVGIGAGVAALAAAAAGAYYFYGAKDAAKNRKSMKGWMIKAKGEVVEKMEKMKDMSEESYNTVVNQVIQKYAKMKNIDPAALAAMAADMRRHWKNISGQVHSPKRKQARAKKVT